MPVAPSSLQSVLVADACFQHPSNKSFCLRVFLGALTCLAGVKLAFGTRTREFPQSVITPIGLEIGGRFVLVGICGYVSLLFLTLPWLGGYIRLFYFLGLQY